MFPGANDSNIHQAQIKTFHHLWRLVHILLPKKRGHQSKRYRLLMTLKPECFQKENVFLSCHSTPSPDFVEMFLWVATHLSQETTQSNKVTPYFQANQTVDDCGSTYTSICTYVCIYIYSSNFSSLFLLVNQSRSATWFFSGKVCMAGKFPILQSGDDFFSNTKPNYLRLRTV